MALSLLNLLSRARTVKDETVENANDAYRIGSLFEDIISFFKSTGVSVPVDTFDSDFVANPDFGKYPTGTNVPAEGKTGVEMILDAFNNYLLPAFTSFASALASPVEVGATLSGNVNFSFSLSNAANVQANTLSITDNTASHVLVSAQAVSSPITVNIGSVKKTAGGATNSWGASVVNSNGQTVYSALATVTWLYKFFHGPVSAAVTTSASVRALSAVWDTTTQFSITLSTTKYVIALPHGRTLTSVVTQNNETITGNFVTSTVDVALPDGSTKNYNVYTFTSAVAMNVTATVKTN